MDGIKLSREVYTSKNREQDSRKCHENMTNRLPAISDGNLNYEECVKQWVSIIGSQKADCLCLCGMKVSEQYYFVNTKNKKICALGVECAKRLNATALKNYKNSLKTKGICWVCGTYQKNLNSHYSLKGHLAKQKELFDAFKVKLNELCKEHIKTQLAHVSVVNTSGLIKLQANEIKKDVFSHLKVSESLIVPCYHSKKVSLTIVLSGKVKFLPTKFDKLVLSCSIKDVNGLENLRNVFYWNYNDVYKFCSDKDVSLKVSPEQKTALCANFCTKDKIEVEFGFEGIYKYGNTWYPLFKLLNFSKLISV